MPTEPYPSVTLGGVDYYQVPCLMPKESDPSRGLFIYFAKPLNGVSGIAGLVQGDPGKHTVFMEEIDFTALAHDDPTPATASIVEVVPGSDTVSQVVQLSLTLHEGEPGDDGSTAIDLESIAGTALAGKVIVVNSAVDGFDFAYPKVGGMHWPASVANAPAGTTATYQLGTIAVAAGVYNFDWRPRINAAGTTIGSTADIQVDIVARLNAADGPVIGRGVGVAGVQTQRVTVTSGPDAGAADSTNRVTAGAAATIFLMSEKQSGAATYSTSTVRFSMEAIAVP